MSSPKQAKSLQAFGLAVAVEIALVAGVALILASSATIHAAHTEPVLLTLVADETPPEKPAEPKPETKPLPVKVVTKTVAPKVPTPPTPVTTQITPPEAAVESDVQTAFAEPAPAKAAPPIPAPSTGKVDPNAEYAAQVHAAVQAAYYYPPAAAAMHFSGRVRVEFQLRDGHVVEPRVLKSCGIALFDKAALQAVQSAHYPEPPTALRGEDLHYQIWVELSTR
ncbi:energy transducer TonB [Solimicrobium silvestre]|uniref:TonB family C-terminal domain n=1 Tax=Solimicrobium silvestre TaxID=2099400 RepID=A0A2S9H1K5_9BURK|nr:TonB family protein [Solimicrobium silvestre]PRC93823.1 TonB family C-terminal domain [Solimicrobium silvestre]